MIAKFSVAAIPALLAAGATTATACPVCATDLGQQVRSGIFGPDFGENVFLTVLPFLVLAAIVAAIHYACARERHALPRPPGPETAPVDDSTEEERVWTSAPIARR